MTVDEKTTVEREKLKNLIDYSDFVTLKHLVGFMSGLIACINDENDNYYKKKARRRDRSPKIYYPLKRVILWMKSMKIFQQTYLPTLPK
ncbi:hypothetical protein FACS189485_19520 [Spirochaetia bacterium]|nr:hypothetical protein FACS189485_19520 [Spirochaetia bacterium]